MSFREERPGEYEGAVIGVYDALAGLSYKDSAEVLRDCLRVTGFLIAANKGPQNVVDFLLDQARSV